MGGGRGDRRRPDRIRRVELRDKEIPRGRTKVIDLAGRMLLPAFQDSHIHLISGGMELGQCYLNDLQTKEEVLAKIGAYAAEHPGQDWIVGADGRFRCSQRETRPRKSWMPLSRTGRSISRRRTAIPLG